MSKCSLKQKYQTISGLVFPIWGFVVFSTLNIVGFWTVGKTKRTVLRCQLGLWELAKLLVEKIMNRSIAYKNNCCSPGSVQINEACISINNLKNKMRKKHCATLFPFCSCESVRMIWSPLTVLPLTLCQEHIKPPSQQVIDSPITFGERRRSSRSIRGFRLCSNQIKSTQFQLNHSRLAQTQVPLRLRHRPPCRQFEGKGWMDKL